MNPYSYQTCHKKKKDLRHLSQQRHKRQTSLPILYLSIPIRQSFLSLSLSSKWNNFRNKYLPKKKKKETLISMKDRSRRLMEAARLPIFSSATFPSLQTPGILPSSLVGRGDATATRATLSLCLFRSGVVRLEPPPLSLSLSLSLSRFDGRRTRTRLVYIVRSETNEEQQRGGCEKERETTREREEATRITRRSGKRERDAMKRRRRWIYPCFFLRKNTREYRVDRVCEEGWRRRRRILERILREE